MIADKGKNSLKFLRRKFKEKKRKNFIKAMSTSIFLQSIKNFQDVCVKVKEIRTNTQKNCIRMKMMKVGECKKWSVALLRAKLIEQETIMNIVYAQ